MSTGSGWHPLEQVVGTLGISSGDLRTILTEFSDLVEIRRAGGQELLSDDGVRYLRAVHRWRTRGLSWQDIRARFSETERAGLDPYPRQIEWADHREDAATTEAEVAASVPQDDEPVTPQALEGTADVGLEALIQELRGDMERYDRVRREDLNRIALGLSRLEQEIQLLRNEIAGTLYRRDRTKRYLGR